MKKKAEIKNKRNHPSPFTCFGAMHWILGVMYPVWKKKNPNVKQ